MVAVKHYVTARPPMSHCSSPKSYEHAMRIIFVAMALAFALTTAMAATMVIAYTG
jgi:hypothetical protein